MHFSTIAAVLAAVELTSAAAILKPRAITAITPPVGFQLALAQNTTETENLSIDAVLSTEKGVEVLLDAGANSVEPGATCTLALNNPSFIVQEGTAKVSQVATVSTSDNLVEFSNLLGGYTGTLTFSQTTGKVTFNPAQIACASAISLRIIPNIGPKNASLTWTQSDTKNTGLTLNVAPPAA